MDSPVIDIRSHMLIQRWLDGSRRFCRPGRQPMVPGNGAAMHGPTDQWKPV